MSPNKPPDPSANRNTLWSSVFVEELYRGGLRVACISPGSRSTPLTLAFVHHPGITVYNLIDERSAGFFGLGLAKASRKPVALLCTSGTAAVNFHPAVVEAALSRVPLLVLTADRPPHLRDVGAGQAIDQIKLYGNSVRWFCEVGEPRMEDVDLRHLRSLAGRALFECVRAPAGAVHLNFPFRKPLEPIPVADDVPSSLGSDHPLALNGLPDAVTSRGNADSQGPAYSQGVWVAPPPPPALIESLSRRIAKSTRGLILCGPMTFAPGDEGARAEAGWPDALALLARRSGYPILAEPPAGLHAGKHDKSQLIVNAEAVLRAAAFREKLKPELVLRFGGMPTNKHVEVLLNEHPACPIVVVNDSGAWEEPTHHPAQVVQADPTAFCEALAAKLGADDSLPGEWFAAFAEADKLAGEALTALYATNPPQGGLCNEWFEGRVVSELAALVPDDSAWFTASSMPVRDLAVFHPTVLTRIRHLVSRGANGIDGTLSTALGIAAAQTGEGALAPTLLLTGDVAFLHDSNGLRAARQYNLPLLVVLVNNDGGGIFEMLPISDYGEAYETHFGTPHGTDFAALCAAHHVPHARVGDWGAFRGLVSQALSSPETLPMVLEVRTDRRHNKAQHQLVWKAVAQRLARAFPPEREL